MLRRSMFVLCAALLVCSPVLADEPQQPDMSALMGALGLAQGGKGSPALEWRTLAEYLVEIDGMEEDEIDGGTFKMANPVVPGQQTSYSTASRRYRAPAGSSGTSEITLTILDSGLASMMMAPFLMAVEYDSPEGSLKSGELSGFPAKFIEELDHDRNVTSRQILVQVADELLVTGKANQFIKPGELKAVIARMDLAGLKKAKEQAASAKTETE